MISVGDLSALPGVATGLLLCFEGRMLGKEAQRLPRQFIQALFTVLQLQDQLLTHSVSPVTLHMIGDTCNRHVALVLAAKEVANIVRHVHQVLRAAHALIIGGGTIPHAFPRAARWRAAYPTARIPPRSRLPAVITKNNSAPRQTRIEPTMAREELLVFIAMAIPSINSGEPTTNSQN
jgi:hypothetical protein